MQRNELQLTGPGAQQGKAGYILLWLLGLPIPSHFQIILLRGSN